MTIRLTRGGAYTSDIRALRQQIRQNGARANTAYVTVCHPTQNESVDLIINMAFEPNGAFPRPPASLYVLGFRNTHGTYTFAIAPWPVAPIAGTILAQDGSYGSLGCAHGLPVISSGNLGLAVTTLSNYSGGAVDQPMKDGLARLIIAVAEGARFGEVERGIDSVLNAGTYAPSLDTLRNWGGRTLGD